MMASCGASPAPLVRRLAYVLGAGPRRALCASPLSEVVLSRDNGPWLVMWKNLGPHRVLEVRGRNFRGEVRAISAFEVDAECHPYALDKVRLEMV